ncbi:ABC transporter permease [Natrarchaeobius sp. A-rgal3]|uniref:ABC transporter permease n=1 Tax=Natrarchaeobius versutus TaxID=1679078 RepID=UPI00350EE7CD
MSTQTEASGPLGRVRRQFRRVELRTRMQYFKPIVGLLLVWELIRQLDLVPRQALPHTYEVAETFVSLVRSGELVNAAALTTYRALLALGIATVVGISIGLAMSRYRPVEWFFDPIVSILFPMPKVIFVPVFLLWFGFGTRGIVLLAATSAVFPVIIATYEGARSVERELIWSARSMGMSRLRSTWNVVMPASLPSIFNGLNIALFSSIIVTLISEMLTSAGGLGQLLIRSLRFFRTSEVLSAVIAAVILGLVMNTLFSTLRAHLLEWSDETADW